MNKKTTVSISEDILNWLDKRIKKDKSKNYMSRGELINILIDSCIKNYEKNKNQVIDISSFDFFLKK